MSLLVVGLSHRSAPVAVLERTALSEDVKSKLLQDILAAEPAVEAAVLGTCNRIELYAEVHKFHAGVAELSTLLSQYSGVGLDQLTPHLYVHYEDRAVHHLFSVACGLDSMVVGEGQILGQIKEALLLGQELHTAGRVLNELFQQALRVGKRAHSETGIDKAGQSLVTFGLDELCKGIGADARVPGPVSYVPPGPRRLAPHLAALSESSEYAQYEDDPPPCDVRHQTPQADPTRHMKQALSDRRALVIGAGSMASLAAATLARAGVTEIVVANRTPERAERLAASVGGRAVPFRQVQAELAAADVVVSCTGATGLVLDKEAVATALATRTSPVPLGLLDLAMPRDVDGAVHDLDGAHLVDIEDLAAAATDDSPASGGRDPSMAVDVDAVRRIVSAEVAAFSAAQRAAHITPTVVALRTMAADVVSSELARLDGRLPDLDDRQHAEITQTVRRVVDKLLHAPTVRVKQLAGEPGGAGYADALRELFDLDPQAVAAVSRADTGDPKRDRA